MVPMGWKPGHHGRAVGLHCQNRPLDDEEPGAPGARTARRAWERARGGAEEGPEGGAEGGQDPALSATHLVGYFALPALPDGNGTLPTLPPNAQTHVGLFRYTVPQFIAEHIVQQEGSGSELHEVVCFEAPDWYI